MPLTKPRIAVASGAPVQLRGWAVDARGHAPAAAVIVDVNGKLYQCRHGLASPDVADYFHTPAYVNSGFVCDLLASAVRIGPNELYLNIVSSGGQTYRRGVVYWTFVE